MPRRRGFRNPFRVEYSPINLSDLRVFAEGTEVTPELLKERGILRSLRRPVKVLAVGELTGPVTVKAHKFSLSARKKIEAIGGSAVELGDGDSG
jgi:large subunit ribosomal protein L15